MKSAGTQGNHHVAWLINTVDPSVRLEGQALAGQLRVGSSLVMRMRGHLQFQCSRRLC